MAKNKKGTRSGLAKYRKKENMTDAEAKKKLFDQLDAEAKRYGKEPTPNKKDTKEGVKKYRRGGKFEEMREKRLKEFTPEELKMMFGYKKGGSVEGKRLTKTVPPKKGPNSQGMRGTGSAIRGTKFKGVF